MGRYSRFFYLLLVAAVISPGTVSASIECYECHGTRISDTAGDFRPLDDSSGRNPQSGGFPGSHRTHLPEGATKSSCVVCHPGTDNYAIDHRDGKIKISSNINSSPLTARYKNQTSVFANSTSAFAQTPTPTLGVCNNVNCHFEAVTPVWGSQPLIAPTNCNSCHDAPPDTGSHTRHFNSLSSASGRTSTGICSKCHPSYASDPKPFIHATSAGRRGHAVTFVVSPNNGGSYAGSVNAGYLPSQNPVRNGICANLYCHSDGNDAGQYQQPQWGGSLPENCSGCHGGTRDSSLPINTNAHGKHINSYPFACQKCHAATVTDVPSIADKSLHINKAKDVAFKDAGDFNRDSKACNNTYCHSDAMGRAPKVAVAWTDTTPLACDSCHRGTRANTLTTMTSAGHGRLVGDQWIRKYPCYYCHYDTANTDNTIKDKTKHVNVVKDVVIAPQWRIDNRPFPAYSSARKTCYNVYCHSDGTANPDIDKTYRWDQGRTECNSCHGHSINTCSTSGCHDGTIHDGRFWPVYTHWSSGQEWRAAVPMFKNEGPGAQRANSHPRHVQTNFTCNKCHAVTIVNGDCRSCHTGSTPLGSMRETAHINADFHVNKDKDVVFSEGGTYYSSSKTCTNTKCHSGTVIPKWGDSVNGSIICLGCHGSNDADLDTFGGFGNGTQAKINLNHWVTTGHGRYSTSGRYPASNNPAANFPANPCWYCHDNTVLHGNTDNPFRLRKHLQYEQRFDKECVYCHMQHQDYECLNCHVGQTSLAPQATSGGIVIKLRTGGSRTDWTSHTYTTGCTMAACHDSDDGTFASGGHKGHSTGAGIWTVEQKNDIKNQYVMMGVCLQCHDDDAGGQCTFCHGSNSTKYSLGFDPGTGFVKPKKARASAAHFGKKHYGAFIKSGGWTKNAQGKYTGTWKGGKFCWDCHDPHGDSNIFMIQDQVATATDGKFGVPVSRSPVSFTSKSTGTDYAGAPNKICNVCHGADSKHYLSNFSDGHNSNKVCTNCHMHRFADAHADSQSCNSCHTNAKPVPKHVAFGLSVICVKCHSGIIGNRADVVGQFNSNSHHVQGPTLTGRHCYACHWEATPFGTIDPSKHEGFNFNSYSGVKNAKVDLVVWQPGVRPTFYSTTSAVQFLANRINTVSERIEIGKLNNHCLSCHSDQNNDTSPFGDCRTPRQYAWDGQSIASRYSQLGTATWGKVNSSTWTNANKKDNVTKAFSAHGNAAMNQGGWNAADGYDAVSPNTRASAISVQCYDCHNSHGSKVNGTTSSYLTFNNTRNGANLKETQKDKGGYGVTYMAQPNISGKNAYAAGAGQCFDCHETQNGSTSKPWGYQSTFGATQPIMGYDDSPRFGGGTKGRYTRFPFRKTTVAGTHFSASAMLNYSSHERINGLCTPCHDPHGVSPTLGDQMAYAVPLLKGTWMTSPYKEDAPPVTASGGTAIAPYRWGGNASYTGWYYRKPSVPVPIGWNTDRNTFANTTPYNTFNRIAESDKQFAGLCTRCHQQNKLTNTANPNPDWKSRERVHKTVKGWGANNEHSFTCSKCHQPHSSALPRLMVTNCLDYQHRGRVASGGKASAADTFPGGYVYNYANSGGGHWGFPIGSIIKSPTGTDTTSINDAAYKADRYKYEALTQCHLRRSGLTISPDYPSDYTMPSVNGQWPQENFWNQVTPWNDPNSPNSSIPSHSNSYY
ncbi:CxxxxCH/CxxCH domain-containing protein [Geobacter sp. OR-1]|uniref:CxxxxCH/CxxCH domain c-type cytochrome n=1 Tax=Geobacter sp. OR-1 TaxID=1266765 RepID=UPI000A80CB7F|nr:CxxxxCH/CxxCH domain-containing protein [Geobacter sp. OR-1]